MVSGTTRVIVMAALVVGAIGGSIWLWEEVLEDRLLPKRFGEVQYGRLYRSGQLHPALVERTLDRHGIDVIVDLDDEATEAAEAESDAAARLGIVHELFPLVGDGTGDIEQYARAIARMKEAQDSGQCVLVHCAAGTHRTGGVVAMYRVFVDGWTPEAAREEMLRYDWRPHGSPLPAFLNKNMAALATRLLELGVIDRVPDPLPRFPE